VARDDIGSGAGPPRETAERRSWDDAAAPDARVALKRHRKMRSHPA